MEKSEIVQHLAREETARQTIYDAINRLANNTDVDDVQDFVLEGCHFSLDGCCCVVQNSGTVVEVAEDILPRLLAQV